MSESTIPPKSEWPSLSIMQLYDVKSYMTNVYYNMRSSNASYANQYLNFIGDLDKVIQMKENEKTDDT